MAVLIDTSVLIDAERRADALERAIDDEVRFVSVITASELLHGVHRATDSRVRARRSAFVEAILAGLTIVPITLTVARAHAQAWAQLAAAGTLVGAHDLWIAATALANGWPIVTANERDFTRVSGLEIRVVP